MYLFCSLAEFRTVIFMGPIFTSSGEIVFFANRDNRGISWIGGLLRTLKKSSFVHFSSSIVQRSPLMKITSDLAVSFLQTILTHILLSVIVVNGINYLSKNV